MALLTIQNHNEKTFRYHFYVGTSPGVEFED